MARNLLKGFYLTTSAFTGSFDPDVLYFVRQDANGLDGYLQLNGKKYGLPSGAISGLTEKIAELSGATVSLESDLTDLGNYVGILPTGITAENVVGYIQEVFGEVTDSLDELSGATESEIGRVEGKVDELSGVTEAFSAGTEAALTTLRTDMTITISGYTDGASGSTGPDATKKYLIKQGNTEVGTIEVPYDIFVDKGTLITVDASGVVTYTQNPDVIASGTTISELAGHAGTYVALKLANDVDSFVYVDVTKLIDIYTVSANSTDYLTIEGYEVATKIIDIADATSATTGLLDAWDVKQYIDEQGSDADQKIAELSGATVSEISRLDTDIAEVSGNTVRKVVVNGYESTFANNTATVDITASSVTLGEAVSGNAANATVTDVLTNIYGELSRIDAAAYQGIETSDDAIDLSAVENNKQTIAIKTEVATDATVQDGHLEIARNDNGELFARMYYMGDDANDNSPS